MRDVVVITGGAGGMGLAAAKIVGRDHAVVICDVSRDRLNAAAAQLTDAHFECTAVVCDITDKKSVAELAAHMLPAVLTPTKRFAYALHNENLFMQKMMSACRIAPKRTRPGMAYSLSKSFVVWYCKSQAGRFGRQGARILSVSPGSIDTQMGRLKEQSGAGAMVDYAALKRFGTAEEIAELLAFCASDKAHYLTGVDILCDGGVTAAMSLRDKLSVGRNS